MTPDDFSADPYGFVTNQAGHAVLVGAPLVTFAMLFLPLWAAPIFVAVIYAGGWEWGWQKRRYPGEFDWRDSLMDTACVMSGASIIAGFSRGYVTGAICLSIFMALVSIGGIRRWRP